MTQTNTQGISKICYRPKVQCFCPLGNDWYTNDMEITMIVGDSYPDYCDVENWLNAHARGKSLIIEDVVKMVYTYFADNYLPRYLSVTSTVSDTNSHSPVTVTKN